MTTPETAIILAPGFEEIEAITIIDVLRRADIPVTIVSLTGTAAVTGAHDITIQTETSLDTLDPGHLSLLVLPGGLPGAEHLAESPRVLELLQAVDRCQGIVAAICAGPLALENAGLLKGRKMTCYPSFKDTFPQSQYVDSDVIQDGRVVTGSGPGTALRFALHLVRALGKEDIAETLRQGMLAL